MRVEGDSPDLSPCVERGTVPLFTLTAAALGLALNATAPPPAAPLDFKQVQPGVWKATVGTPEDPDAAGRGSCAAARALAGSLPPRFHCMTATAWADPTAGESRCDSRSPGTRRSTGSAWTSPRCGEPA